MTFNFNWFDRLASTTLNASTTLDFLYDYSGQRTLKQQAFDTIDTEFNPITLLYTDYYPNKLYEEKISEVEGDPQSIQSEEVRHIMLGNQTIANVKRVNYSNPAISLVFSDHLGSSAIVTDSLSRVKTIYDYLPYGGERNSDETYNYTTDYRFTGKELDEETSLSYYGARYYMAGVGRFTQVDPLSRNIAVSDDIQKLLTEPQRLNAYSYALNNPIRYTDPTGKDAEITINEKDKTITISAKIYIYGDDASEEVAATMQKDINEAWNQGQTYYNEENDTTYSVNFDVKVEYIKHPNIQKFIKALGLNDSGNVIEINNKARSSVKVKQGYLGEWRGNDPDPAPHEFGHLLGLKDRYTDLEGTNKDWEGNIMGEPAMEGSVDQRNINTIVSPYMDKHNNRAFKSINNVTQYHIAPRKIEDYY